MKRALIISDTHGLKEEVAHVASLYSFDISFHKKTLPLEENLESKVFSYEFLYGSLPEYGTIYLSH
jgi:hypothetical protein